MFITAGNGEQERRRRGRSRNMATAAAAAAALSVVAMGVYKESGSEDRLQADSAKLFKLLKRFRKVPVKDLCYLRS